MSPRVCFACVRYGEPEKVYLERQFAAFTRITPHILAWEDHRPASPRREPLALAGMPWEGSPGERLRRRLARALGADEHVAVGAERRRLAQRLRELAPHLIYAHLGFVGMRLLPVARRLGLPLAVHLHGIDVHTAQRNPLLARRLLAAVAAFDRVFVVGRYMKQWIGELGARTDHVVVSPMGAPIPPDEPAPCDASPEIRVLAVGRLVPYKGFDRAIDAIHAVRDRFPNLRLRIVGEGPQRAALAARVERLSLGRQVSLLGERSPQETQRLLKQCDLLLHPASDEPDGPEASGVVIAEAMAHGRPVLSTYCGGIPDQVISGETGILVPQNDATALAAALAALLADGAARQRLGKAARALAVEALDATKLARRVEDVLLDVLRGRPRD